jgi:hypothetical protein
MTEADGNLRRSIRRQLAAVPPDTWDFNELTIILGALTEIAGARPPVEDGAEVIHLAAYQ